MKQLSKLTHKIALFSCLGAFLATCGATAASATLATSRNGSTGIAVATSGRGSVSAVSFPSTSPASQPKVSKKWSKKKKFAALLAIAAGALLSAEAIWQVVLHKRATSIKDNLNTLKDNEESHKQFATIKNAKRLNLIKDDPNTFAIMRPFAWEAIWERFTNKPGSKGSSIDDNGYSSATGRNQDHFEANARSNSDCLLCNKTGTSPQLDPSHWENMQNKLSESWNKFRQWFTKSENNEEV